MLFLLVFKLSGWRAIHKVPSNLKKYVVVGAPHTSNWDGFWSVAYASVHQIPFKFLVKSDLFFFPLGIILKWLGGLPVDRGKNNSLVDQCASYFNKAETMVIGVTPEATRKYNPHWKKGFYYISEKAQVPLVVGYVDYQQKIISMDHVFEKSKNIELDIEKLKSFYRTKKGKYPEKGVI